MGFGAARLGKEGLGDGASCGSQLWGRFGELGAAPATELRAQEGTSCVVLCSVGCCCHEGQHRGGQRSIKLPLLPLGSDPQAWHAGGWLLKGP